MLYGQFQPGHAGEAVAADALVGDVAEEALDHVQPRRAGGREVHDESRVLGQPGLNLRMAVLRLSEGLDRNLHPMLCSIMSRM